MFWSKVDLSCLLCHLSRLLSTLVLFQSFADLTLDKGLKLSLLFRVVLARNRKQKHRADAKF